MEKHIHVKGIKYNLVLKKGKKESIVIKDNDFIRWVAKIKGTYLAPFLMQILLWLFYHMEHVYLIRLLIPWCP